jgi:hypothetical protein
MASGIDPLRGKLGDDGTLLSLDYSDGCVTVYRISLNEGRQGRVGAARCWQAGDPADVPGFILPGSASSAASCARKTSAIPGRDYISGSLTAPSPSSWCWAGARPHKH